MADIADVDFLRQLSILDPARYGNAKITVIGAGGIGSLAIIALVKTGFNNLTVYDGDIVAGHNIPNQFYRPRDVGSLKVEAISSICEDFAGVRIMGIPEMYDGQHPLSGIVISGVDSMAARRKIWEDANGIRQNPNVSIYIEARMAGEYGIINTVQPCNPDHIEWYEKTISYSDEEAEAVACTNRAVAYNVFGLASLIASQVKRHVKYETMNKEIIFDLSVPIIATQSSA